CEWWRDLIARPEDSDSIRDALSSIQTIRRVWWQIACLAWIAVHDRTGNCSQRNPSSDGTEHEIRAFANPERIGSHRCSAKAVECHEQVEVLGRSSNLNYESIA